MIWIILAALTFVAAGVIRYQRTKWICQSLNDRSFVTWASPDQVHALFAHKVAYNGWEIVEDSNPMLAEHTRGLGIRQQLRLMTSPTADGRTSVRVGPARHVRCASGWTRSSKRSSFLTPASKCCRSGLTPGSTTRNQLIPRRTSCSWGASTLTSASRSSSTMSASMRSPRRFSASLGSTCRS